MKNIIMAFVLCLISVYCLSQDEIGHYYCEYFNKEYSIKYANNGYRIQISGESKDDYCYFLLYGESDINSFRQSLDTLKKKYVEWYNVAKTNNVTSLYKYMDVQFKSGEFFWYSVRLYVARYATPKPRFFIKDGKYLCIMFGGEEFTATTNEFITCKAYWVFTSVEEIENLQKLLSEETLQKFKSEKNKVDDLFK